MTDVKLTEEEFQLLRRVVHDQTGIALGESKLALVEARLRRRLRELGLSSYFGYYRRLKESASPHELQELVDAITTQTTSFFREPKHFEFLQRELVPAWRRRADEGERRVRVWSAACSTGQEPWSLAAVLEAGLGGLELDARVLATDVSARALRAAERADYPLENLLHLPEGWRRAFRAVGRGTARRMGVSDDLRRWVTFRHLNLLAPRFPFHGQFDAIFCRNVLIYFDEPTRRGVVARLLELLAPGGHLILGMSEALVQVPRDVEPLGCSIYRARGR